MAKAEVTYKLTVSESTTILRALDEFASLWEEKAEAIEDVSNPDRAAYMRWTFEARELKNKLVGKAG